MNEVMKIRHDRFRPPSRICNQPSSRLTPRAGIDAVRVDDCAARRFRKREVLRVVSESPARGRPARRDTQGVTCDARYREFRTLAI